MTRRQSRIVAAQAVVVGVLMVVVFLTLLRPEEKGPLFGVDKPSLPGVGAGPNPAYAPDHHAEGPRAGDRTTTGGGAPPTAEGGVNPSGSSAGAILPAPSTTPPPAQPSPGDGNGESPTGDQYDDTLTRLVARLN